MSQSIPWQTRGACNRVKDPDIFFAQSIPSPEERRKRIQEAKDICRTCPVIDVCLQHALDNNEEYGIWGGLSEDERRNLRRRAMRQYRMGVYRDAFRRTAGR